jgi:hypothetical protein
MNSIALFDHLYDRARRFGIYGHHGVVQSRVELLTNRVNRMNSVPPHPIEKRLPHQLDSLSQWPGITRPLRGVRGTRQVIQHRQQVQRKWAVQVTASLRMVAVHTLLIVLEVGALLPQSFEQLITILCRFQQLLTSERLTACLASPSGAFKSAC